VFKARHIQTTIESDTNKDHEKDVNAALADVGERPIHDIRHSVTCQDGVFTGGNEAHNGTAWMCSTLIIFWDE
jgi:hypothetical protein